MALIRLPEGQQRSGSTGGVVFSHNRGGPYTRARSIPVNPNTDRQSAVRGYLAALASAWYTELDDSQRTFWDIWAKSFPWTNRLGMSISMTGMNAYIRANAPRLQAGLDVVDDAPVTFEQAPGIIDLTASASAATQKITITWYGWVTWEATDGAGMLISMGQPTNPTRKYFGGPWRFYEAIPGDHTTPPTSPTVLTADAPFGIAEGQRIWVQARITMDDGRLGEIARCNFLAAA